MTQNKHDDGPLTRDDVVAALIAGPTKTAAAKALGISRATLYRWLRDDPVLREAYDAARHAALVDATEALQSIAEDAVGFLHELAANPDTPAQVRATASAKILDSAYKAYELHELAKRVEALEKELV